MRRIALRTLHRYLTEWAWWCTAVTDVKDKFDAAAFRKDVLPILCDADYNEATDFLEKGQINATDGGDPRKLDYHEYADTLFDIMICGGTLGVQ